MHIIRNIITSKVIFLTCFSETSLATHKRLLLLAGCEFPSKVIIGASSFIAFEGIPKTMHNIITRHKIRNTVPPKVIVRHSRGRVASCPVIAKEDFIGFEGILISILIDRIP